MNFYPFLLWPIQLDRLFFWKCYYFFMSTIINSPQEFIKDVIVEAIGTPSTTTTPWINVLSYFKIPKGKGFLYQRVLIGSPETVRPVLPGVIAIIHGSFNFSPGRHSATQRRDLAKCTFTLDLWHPEDMPDPEEYRQNIEEVEGLGLEIPLDLETLDDAKNLVMQALYDRHQVVRSIREIGVSQREQSKGYTERAAIQVEFLPSTPIQGYFD